MSVRDRYELWAKPASYKGFIVRDVRIHKNVWEHKTLKECAEICDLLNEAFEAGRLESLKVTG